MSVSMSKKKQSCRSNRICFTLNNFTPIEKQALEDHLTLAINSKSIAYAIVGVEKGQTGTPHLQGYIHYPTSIMKASTGTVSRWRSLIPSLARAHLETARGSDLDSKLYCSKDLAFQEWGTPTENGNTWEQLSTVTTLEEAREISPETYVKNFFQLKAIAHQNLNANRLPLSLPNLRQWQAEVEIKLLLQNKREILCIQDTKGNTGKSALALHLRAKYGSSLFYCDSGKSDDVAHALSKVQDLDIAVFDYPRNTHPQFLPWRVIEGLKNGVLTSPKYDSTTVFFGKSVMVLILTNHDLSTERHRLSDDRWNIIDLDMERSIKGDEAVLGLQKPIIAEEDTVFYANEPGFPKKVNTRELIRIFTEKYLVKHQLQGGSHTIMIQLALKHAALDRHLFGPELDPEAQHMYNYYLGELLHKMFTYRTPPTITKRIINEPWH